MEAGAPNVGNGTEETPAAAGVAVVAASFFSAGWPKLNPAKGEGFAAASSLDGNVGLNPVAAPDCGVLLELATGSVKPPTAGRAGFVLAGCDAGSTGLNPLAVDEGVDDDGAGSLNPPALGIDGGGAGMATDGFLASGAFLCGGSIVEVSSSMAVASRFFVCVCAPLADGRLFPAFFVISCK